MTETPIEDDLIRGAIPKPATQPGIGIRDPYTGIWKDVPADKLVPNNDGKLRELAGGDPALTGTAKKYLFTSKPQ